MRLRTAIVSCAAGFAAVTSAAAETKPSPSAMTITHEMDSVLRAKYGFIGHPVAMTHRGNRDYEDYFCDRHHKKLSNAHLDDHYFVQGFVRHVVALGLTEEDRFYIAFEDNGNGICDVNDRLVCTSLELLYGTRADKGRIGLGITLVSEKDTVFLFGDAGIFARTSTPIGRVSTNKAKIDTMNVTRRDVLAAAKQDVKTPKGRAEFVADQRMNNNKRLFRRNKAPRPTRG